MGNCNFNKEKGSIPNKETEKINKNHFTFLYAIGKGGFGRVWKVEKKGKKEIFAMKEMSKVKIYEKNSVQSIINERKLLAHLRHPFIINMHYAFQDKENLFLVMDYLSGGDLRFHICKQKTFNEEQARFFITCLILALEYLHYNKIMHRDIKPENLVFDNKGYLYLTDLGIAKLSRPDKTVIDSSGTPGYMAPEVIANQHHDLVSDFFAIGVMTYEFMFGKRPFVGKNRKDIRDQIFSKEINVKVSDVPPGWSLEAADFINKLLRRKSKERLGKGGIFELKDHSWLKGIKWHDVYKKEIPAPFVPTEEDNFDAGYCNKEDQVDKQAYEYYLHKISTENYFIQFYFNFFDIKYQEPFFEIDNVQYKFFNIHEECSKELNKEEFNAIGKQKIIIGSSLSNTPRLDLHSTSISNQTNLFNYSHLSQRRIFGNNN